MERIALNRNEKKVLRMVESGITECPPEFPRHTFHLCVHSLERKGLVKGAYVEGGNVECCQMTSYGKTYIAENPRLCNPINWSKIASIAAILSVLVSFLALFVTCQTLSR